MHGKLPKIPASWNNENLIVLSGDQCDNFGQNFIPCIKYGNKLTPTSWNGFWNFRKIDIEAESQCQKDWVKNILIPHLLKNNVNLDRCIWINGNHDFLNVSDLFVHSCFDSAKTIVIDGIKIGLLIGCLPIVFEWHQEISEDEMDARIKTLDPAIDILISHSPPKGIRDLAYSHGGEHIGSQAITNSIFGKSIAEKPYFNSIRYHLYGHAHSAKGGEKHLVDERLIRFYNAATTRLNIDFGS